ncbi:MAG: FG-GAP-like repeat-containing protein, partial [candidate division WOR-3 bacterium]
GTDGALKWTFATGNYIRSSPAIADCDGDGAVEVVIGSDDSKLYCLRGSDGTPKWVRTFPSRIHLPGALVDVDGDGKLETLVSQISYSGSPTDTLYALNAEDGSVCWKIGLPYDVHSPFAGDIDGDMCVEIITGTYHTDAQGYRIFAIDDPENTSGCGLLNIGEAGASDGLEFKAIGGKEIYLFLPKETRVSVSLYDASGKLIQRFYDGILAQGAHTFVLNPENKGVYLAILRWKEGVKTAKIVR